MKDGTLSYTQRVILTNIMREMFINSLKVSSFDVELYSKTYPNGQLVVVFGSPKKADLDEFVNRMKKDLLLDPILVSGYIIMQYVYLIIPRGSNKSLFDHIESYERTVVDLLKQALLYNFTDVNFLANITAPFIDYYEGGRVSVEKLVNEIKSNGCIYCLNCKDKRMYNYTGFKSVSIRVDDMSIVRDIEEERDAIPSFLKTGDGSFTKHLTELCEEVREEREFLDGLNEAELRKRIKYAKHPMERRRLEQLLADKVRNNGRHRHATKKKKKR